MNLNDFLRRMSLTYAAGTFGGLCVAFLSFVAGEYRWTDKMHVAMHPDFSATWFFPRLVIGGICGFLFILPIAKGKPFIERALLFCLVPTLIHLLYIFPFREHLGYFGFQLGALTPLYIFILYFVWAVLTAIWLKIVG